MITLAFMVGCWQLLLALVKAGRLIDYVSHTVTDQTSVLRFIQTRHDLFLAEVVAARADARVYRDGRWHFDDGNRELHTLHHLGEVSARMQDTAGVFA